jgi:hypothetical protein
MADLPNTWTVGSTSLMNRILWLCLLTLVYTVLTVFVFRNFIPHLSSALIGPPEDNMQDFWNTWYASQVRTFHDLGYTNLIKYPEGTTLYYHSFSYPKIVIAMIFGKLFGTRLAELVVLQNLFLFISFPISAIGGFYLARHFTRDCIGAMAAGAVFAFNPSHVAHAAHHMHVSSIEFIPFFALSFILAVERRSRIFILLSTLCFALSALSSWYYLFYCAYFMAFFYAIVAIKRRRLLHVWPLVVILCNIVGVWVLLSPLLVPMIAQAARGVNVYQTGADTFVADLVGYVAFPRAHLLSALSKQVYPHLTGNEWEATVYLGLVNIALLVWLIVRCKHLNRDLIKFVLTGMGLFTIIASGNHLHVFGFGDGHIPPRLAAVHYAFGLPIPHLLLSHLPYVFSHSRIPLPGLLLSYLPFFKNLRTPSRAITFVYMFLSIGVGYALSVIWRKRGSTWSGRGAVVVVVFLMAVDWYPRPLPGTPVVCLPAYSLVIQDPDRHVAVLDLPRGYVEDRGYVDGNAYMMYQTCHLHPIVDGNIARIVNKTLDDRLVTNDLELQRRQLTDNKVKYIVIHRPEANLFQWSPKDGLIVQYVRTYPAVYSGEDAMVLRVY